MHEDQTLGKLTFKKSRSKTSALRCSARIWSKVNFPEINWFPNRLKNQQSQAHFEVQRLLLFKGSYLAHSLSPSPIRSFGDSSLGHQIHHEIPIYTIFWFKNIYDFMIQDQWEVYILTFDYHGMYKLPPESG